MEADWFFTKKTKWQEEYSELRLLVLECGLIEKLKWGCPCYVVEKSNVVLIHGFKDYCALLFMQGDLMKDDQKLLIQQTAKVQSARQLRFRNVEEILTSKSIIDAYIKDAVEIDKAGLKFEKKGTPGYDIPNELQNALDAMPEVKDAFYSLTPGRQRGYLLYFSSAKQAKTREARVEKYLQQILEGKGLDD
jgi:uncharacterized protein YdeI (YjbR/CyaY-like superfamily)